MNRQGYEGDGKGGIEWLKPPLPSNPGFTWNPVDGCTNTFCEVRNDCWARRMAKRQHNDDFRPRLHKDRLGEPAGRETPAIIGTCLMGDLFSDGVPSEWIRKVIQAIFNAPQHLFIILTKNPQRIWEWTNFVSMCPNLWLGTSISGYASMNRMYRLKDISHLLSNRLVLSIEPLHDPIRFVEYGFDLEGFGWVFVGGQSGPKSFKPPIKWIDSIIEQVHKYHPIPILIKDNAGYPRTVREWPQSILTHLNGGELRE